MECVMLSSILMFVALVVVGFFKLVRVGFQDGVKMVEAQAEYKAALVALQQANTSANRVRVLESGRYYASLCREGGNATMFDEVALQNDLKAYGGD